MKIVGVDVGGTFIDVISIDSETGQCNVVKRATRQGEQARTVFEAVAQTAGDVAGVDIVVHGTTIATNTLIERSGAKVGLITTRGFRDVLEMRRRDRPRLWGMGGDYKPLIPRNLRYEIDERTLHDGTVETPIDESQIDAAVTELLDQDVEAVVISFLNAYVSSENEQRAAELVRERWPNPFVSVAHEVGAEIREFERTSTSVVNSYLQPLLAGYMEALERRFEEGGYDRSIFITQSNGGIMSPASARNVPMRTVLSGPAAGVVAAKNVAEAAGHDNVIVCDMGGTSFDVSLIVNGQTVLRPQAEVDFGIVIRTPMLEISAIGAGGGSIASVDQGGLLQVGPKSAGSYPGPVCYGRGNELPTVTDAHVVLRRIDAEKPIGADRALDVAAAENAVLEHVGKPLGLSVQQAAEAIIKVADTNMGNAIRLVSVERGHDPKRFVGMFFGGAGALHCGALIQDVGLAQAIVPAFPGVTCALGCAQADLRTDYVQTINQRLAILEGTSVLDFVKESAAKGRDALAGASALVDHIEVSIDFDMSYVGQTHTVVVSATEILSMDPAEVPADKVREAFEETYQREYGRLLPDMPINILSVRVSVLGVRQKRAPIKFSELFNSSSQGGLVGERDVWMEGAWRKVPIYSRFEMPLEHELLGPAILQQEDTTIYLDDNLKGHHDPHGNFVIARR